MKRVLSLLTFLLIFCQSDLNTQNTDVVRLAESAIQSGFFKPGGGVHRLQIGVGHPNKIVTGLKSINLLDNVAGINLDGIAGNIGQALGLGGTNSLRGEGKATPQINMSFDLAINEQLSIGPYFGYAQATTPILILDIPEVTFDIPLLGTTTLVDPIKGEYQYKFRLYSYGLRAVVNQKNANEKLQLYVVGYAGITKYVVEEKVIAGDPDGLETDGLVGQLFADDSFNSTTPNLSLAGQIGGRYNFSPKVGIYLEAGYGLNIFNAGLIFNFHKKKVQAREGIDAGDLKTGTSN